MHLQYVVRCAAVAQWIEYWPPKAIVIRAVSGILSIGLLRVAAVAQWIEYRPPKPRVVGSIPASRTKIKDLREFSMAHDTVKFWFKSQS